jgi:hypothetical protein
VFDDAQKVLPSPGGSGTNIMFLVEKLMQVFLAKTKIIQYQHKVSIIKLLTIYHGL